MKIFCVLLAVTLFSGCAVPASDNTAAPADVSALAALDAGPVAKLSLTAAYDASLHKTVMNAALDFGSGPIPITVSIDFYADYAMLAMVPRTHVGKATVKDGKAVLATAQKPGTYHALAVWENAPGGRRRSQIVKYTVPGDTSPVIIH
jgi:hypothetical protein